MLATGFPRKPGSWKHVSSAAYWLVPPVFCLALYWDGLGAWFHHDDFAWLRLRSQIESWSGLFNALFTPSAHGTFRPLSERAFFLVLGTLFPGDALPFRMVVFLTQFANLALLGSIVWRLTRSRTAGFWAPLFWTANSVLVTAMTWTSAYMQVSCAFFLLLAFHFLLRYAETGRRRYYLLQWAAFLLGFGAMETNVVYPVLAAGYALLCAPKRLRSTLPLFVPSVLFGVARVIAAQRQPTSLYALHLDGRLPQTFWTYWQWSLAPANLPALTSLPRWVGPAVLAILTVALIGFVLRAAWRRHWLPLFFMLWFAVTLAPVLLLPDHLADYYLTLPASGLAMLGGCAFASAWRRRALWKAAAALLAGAFFLLQLPAAHAGARWWRDQSRAVKRLVIGVSRARELHPQQAILLTGVNNDLFWGAVREGAFSAMGVSAVYLAPGSELNIQSQPGLDSNVSSFIAHPYLVARALERGDMMVYQAGGSRLLNITPVYQIILRSSPVLEKPRRVDVGDPLSAPLLGPTWYPIQDGQRWMPASATVQMAGPQSPEQRLYISGYCPAFQEQAGPAEMLLRVDGKPLATVPLSRGDSAFTFDFQLPRELAGRPSVEITVQTVRTVKVPGNPRDLGLSFGVFEIR